MASSYSPTLPAEQGEIDANPGSPENPPEDQESDPPSSVESQSESEEDTDEPSAKRRRLE